MPKGVYTLSNDVADNQVFAYSRAADGSLTLLNSFSTFGKGTSAPLGNQNALVFDATQNLFFVANSGDNTISMMQLQSDGKLTVQDKKPTFGIKPVSVTVSGSVVYVVHAGDNFTPANIVGFQIGQNKLNMIANSSKNLSTNTPDPAQIQFNSNGTVLVVTEKATNKIDTFTVSAGVPTGPSVQASNGMRPFGFAYSMNQQLIVTEASSNAVSSYTLGTNGMITSVSSSISSTQMGTCWVAVVRDTAYVTNTTSNTVSAYKITAQGTLTLSNATAGMTGMGPIDLDVTDGSEYLYTLNNKDHTFSVFTINADGSLVKKTDVPNVPMNAVGLVAR